MKKKNIYKITWLTGMYLFLILLLFLIVEYKVKWEGRDLNKYLYFYNCSESLCTTELKTKKYYSKYLCKEKCPMVKTITDDIVILQGIDNGAIFNYKEGKIINNKYVSYNMISKDKIVVSNGTKKGIIDLEGKILLASKYDDIEAGIGTYVKVKSNNLWGIKSIGEDKQIVCKYDDLDFVTNNILLVSSQNKYYFIDYLDNKINDKEYNYLHYIDNYILAIANKKVDILDTKLNSKLKMEINTIYDYREESERKSLNIVSDKDYIYFTIFKEDNPIKYKYHKERNTISY